ncbi:ArnT family glycosyltransferase [Williamsia sp. MIQD14]|uniref:ArnT family glycosyltransferase n=1 Tax=Williamsia sp. MIQD14 TaxID=3425703 RepID=UPI003DA1B34C
MTATVSVPADTAPTVGRAARDTGSDRAHRIAFVALIIGTAVLYLWDLSINRYANDFYAAAEQAGSQSWKAWFFGASDAANSITVDKPPVSLWISGLAVRVFGLNSWSILVPQALMGVAAVALIYVIARRVAGPWAGLVAGVVLALQPVAAVMFRFNNPDALLVLLLIGAAWATLRILDDGCLRWAVLAGGLIGLAFLTKQLQALLIVPPIAVVYLVCGPTAVRTRIVHLLAALGAAIVGAGWWVLTVELWPAGSRPYIGGTEHNSIIELTLGYNGLGRLTGDEGSGLGGARGAGGSGGSAEGMNRMLAAFGGQTGILRMFSPAVGGQVGWLIPAALVLGAAAIAVRGRVARTDLERAVLVFAWLWLFSNAVLMSYMAGIFHPYYTLALVPPIALLVGIGSVRGWQHRETLWVRGVLVVSVIVTAVLAVIVLGRTPDFQAWLRPFVIAVAVIAVVGLVVERFRPGRWATRAVVVAAVVVGLAGPLAYTLDTVGTPRVGGLATAGPKTGTFPGFGNAPRAMAPGAQQAAKRMFTGEAPPRAVTDLLARDADDYRWAAATVSALSASGYQLAIEKPVMPVGGFSGGDPSPTLAQFQRYVADHQIHWFIAFASPIPMRESTSASAQITSWVMAHHRPQIVDGVTLYDLNP